MSVLLSVYVNLHLRGSRAENRCKEKLVRKPVLEGSSKSLVYQGELIKTSTLETTKHHRKWPSPIFPLSFIPLHSVQKVSNLSCSLWAHGPFTQRPQPFLGAWRIYCSFFLYLLNSEGGVVDLKCWSWQLCQLWPWGLSHTRLLSIHGDSPVRYWNLFNVPSS